MKKLKVNMPVFKSESEEADWWASREGRELVKQGSAKLEARKAKPKGSPLVASLNRKNSIQIALRVPETDLVEARRIAERKGIGYQTLLKMLLHEGLQREARRH
ncbi:MAG: hypothetical protein JO182_08255 [Acidobacteriaceae bacterium]|nr:hypothetical protein [Acidobacteriaceae bacterium]MBV9034471.1 hypothetical protein [Acidobacteriaceae bacterium]MBV9226607.1 hypothetical protein [Acidobacteriaceae bacterium]MBV9307941.1 hypothetical protein [Acidobacteriaceae bacterium]MBV9678389.1 hypothetical protein [Acidobacteriaceae bacterium]